MVWQRISPASAETAVRQERRKGAVGGLSSGVRGERASMPGPTSTRHSLHLPCLGQEVGTRTPSDSAQSKIVEPKAALVDCPLMVSVAGIGDVAYQAAWD